MNGRPKVLLAGDSISMGYGPVVASRIGDRYDVSILPANGGTSANLLAHVEDWFAAPNFDLIHVNCGLHDLGRERDKTGPRVDLRTYEANLRELFRRLRAETRSHLAWATTTPVIDERHAARKDFDRYEKDVTAFNRVGVRVASEAGLPVHDLHAVVVGAGAEGCIGEDGVHMTKAGYDTLAKAVAEFVIGVLKA